MGDDKRGDVTGGVLGKRWLPAPVRFGGNAVLELSRTCSVVELSKSALRRLVRVALKVLVCLAVDVARPVLGGTVLLTVVVVSTCVVEVGMFVVVVGSSVVVVGGCVVVGTVVVTGHSRSP